MPKGMILKWNFPLHAPLHQEGDVIWIDAWIYGENVRLITLRGGWAWIDNEKIDDDLYSKISDLYEQFHQEIQIIFSSDLRALWVKEIDGDVFSSSEFREKFEQIEKETQLKVSTALETLDYVERYILNKPMDEDEILDAIEALFVDTRQNFVNLLKTIYFEKYPHPPFEK